MDGLLSICAGLGIIEEDDNENRIGYAKGEFCLDNLKDLLRFLRRDNLEKREVFKQICKWNTVGKDLIPIIEHYPDDRNLVLNSVKVLVFLTMPVEPTSVDIPQQIEYLWGLKSAITASNIVPVIVSLLESPLENLENESFTDDDWKLVQLVLTLFRNILAIQNILPQQKLGGSATQFLSLRDSFLELMFQENVMDLILLFAQHTRGSNRYLRQDNLLILEILYYIFKGQEPASITKSHSKNSKAEEETGNSVSSLQSIIKEEQEKRMLIRLRNTSGYSQFSGTFSRKNMDGTQALFKGNPCSASGDALLKAHKRHRGRSKKITWDHEELPSTRIQVLELLKDFISQFLGGGYNVLMQSILEDIEKDSQHIQSSDVVIFFHVAQFVTSFQYYRCLASKPSFDVDKEASEAYGDDTLFKGSMCGPIAETLKESMFLMIISKWRYAFEGIKQTNDYKFLSAASSLIKTLIRMLDLVLKQSSEDSMEPQTVRILLYKLFYDQTEEGLTQFLFVLIKSFDSHKQSKSDLADLVESIHVILRLMENLQARGTLRVSKKSRKKKKMKATLSKIDVGDSTSVGNESTHNDAGGPNTECSTEANLPVKENLTNEDFDGEPVEKSRDPNLFDEPLPEPAKQGINDSEMEDKNMADDLDRAYFGTDDSSGDEQQVLTGEVDFKVSSLVSALANNTIIQNLCWLLKFYKSNAINTNHYIITLLQRICDDLELSPMLYQLSLLTIFYDIMEEQKLRPCKEHKNIVTFLTTLVRRMLRKMKSYPLLFVEILFWKTRKECHYINCGSMINELNGLKSGNGEGRNGSEKEDGSSQGQKWVRRNYADALGEDDFEMPHEDSQERDGSGEEDEASVLNNEVAGANRKEKSDEEDPNIISKEGNDFVLTDELQSKLKDLYDKYKDDSNLCQLIAGELDPHLNISKMQVSKTLKKLGLNVLAKKKRHSSGAANSILEENPMPEKSMHSRKRAHALTVDQEQQIKELFKQFHDHKRCSFMIAQALDSEGKISTAQISRKLRQLGLVVPKKKRSDADKLSKDENSDDSFAHSAGESDDEPLSSLRNRGKDKRTGTSTADKHNQEIPEGRSDDELLSALVKPNKRSRKIKNDRLLVEPNEDKLAKINSDGSDKEVSNRHEEHKQADQMDALYEHTEIANNPSDSETGNTKMDTQYASDKNDNDLEDPVIDNELLDELPDFDENQPPETTQDTVSRRRKMVIDSDEE